MRGNLANRSNPHCRKMTKTYPLEGNIWILSFPDILTKAFSAFSRELSRSQLTQLSALVALSEKSRAPLSWIKPIG